MNFIFYIRLVNPTYLLNSQKNVLPCFLIHKTENVILLMLRLMWKHFKESVTNLKCIHLIQLLALIF